MKTRIMSLLFVAFLVAGSYLHAEVVAVNNKICPVMGGAVNDKITVEYQGKAYKLCCPGCKDAFLADPEKYIAKIEAELAASKDAVAGAPAVVPSGN